MTIFDHAHPKIIESSFGFPEFVPAWKKNHFNPSFIFESRDQTEHTNFWPCPRKNILTGF